MSIYTGYVYLWFDTKARFFYIGGHFGSLHDSYVCSSRIMLRAYKQRPQTFKFRVLEYTYGTTKSLRETEQRWLNMIKDHELMLSENIKNKTCRYYNVKKNSTGGNGKGTNKGKSHSPWNKGLDKSDPRVKNYSDKLSASNKGKRYGIPCNPKMFDKKECPICHSLFDFTKNRKTYCSKLCSAKGTAINRKVDREFPPDPVG